MVGRRPLTPFVKVRVLLPEPCHSVNQRASSDVGPFSFWAVSGLRNDTKGLSKGNRELAPFSYNIRPFPNFHPASGLCGMVKLTS